MRELIFEIITTIASILALVLTIYAFIIIAGYECKIKAQKQELEYDFGLIQGCMIKHNGKWVDYKKYRVTDYE